MSKKRKLKHPGLRRTNDRVTFNTLAQTVSERTGYKSDDIKEVLRTAIKVIIEIMCNNQAIVLPFIGMFYPYIRTARRAVALKGGQGKPEIVNVPARWVARFRPGAHVVRELMKKDPTPEQIEDLYEDED